MGLELLAMPGVLVPREETELLGRTSVGKLREAGSGSALRVIDMCCGSGNLACAIATNSATASVWACDLTEQCVLLTQKNVARLGLAGRVTVLQGDLFGALAGLDLEGTIDAIVCNPPYISSGRLAERPDLSHEPKEAFDGGPYGVSIQQRVLKEGAPFLRPGGFLFFEFGLGQERQLKMLFERTGAYETPEFVENDAGEPRVAYGRRRALGS
jgi:release factor glutamine methyltransferase